MATSQSSETPKKKHSTVRHTRAIQYDRTKRINSMPLAPQVSAELTQIVHPQTLAQVAHFRRLGLRERVLTLPVMVALVLQMIWRQIPSTCELTRLLHQEGFLWCSPIQVTEQALAQRLRTFPAELFQRVLEAVLPVMHTRWAARTRPLPPVLAWVQARYAQVWAVDGSTLDVLLRKVGLLRGAERPPLAGRMTALLDLLSRLPRQIWFEEDPQANDQRFWPRIQAALERGTLLLYDLGYTNFTVFRELTAAGVTWVTRAKSNLVYTVDACLVQTAQVRDELVWIGSGADRQLVRLVQVLVGATWRRYLTSEWDAQRLPAAYVAALYAQRWRIEEAYLLVKRLLGLAYLWTGSANGVALQLWATWLLYAVLIDLTDAVAARLDLPLSALSIEMTYRSLYYFTSAHQQGKATEVVAYLAENATWLGIIKRKRKRKIAPLDLLTNPAGA
jgi:Transposase DDE domain